MRLQTESTSSARTGSHRMCFGSVPMLNLSLLSPLSSYDWRILNPRRAFKPCAEFIFRNKQARIAFALANVHSPHLCFHDPHCVLSGYAKRGRNVFASHHQSTDPFFFDEPNPVKSKHVRDALCDFRTRSPRSVFNSAVFSLRNPGLPCYFCSCKSF